jgi:hypothetical protein
MPFASSLHGVFTFLAQGQVICGEGSLAQLAAAIDRLGCLGGHYHVPHGQMSCIILPYTTEFNLPIAANRLTLAADAGGLETHGMNTELIARVAVDTMAAIHRCTRMLEAPPRRGSAGARFPAGSRGSPGGGSDDGKPAPIRGVADVIDLPPRAW